MQHSTQNQFHFHQDFKQLDMETKWMVSCVKTKFFVLFSTRNQELSKEHFPIYVVTSTSLGVNEESSCHFKIIRDVHLWEKELLRHEIESLSNQWSPVPSVSSCQFSLSSQNLITTFTCARVYIGYGMRIQNHKTLHNLLRAVWNQVNMGTCGILRLASLAGTRSASSVPFHLIRKNSSPA